MEKEFYQFLVREGALFKFIEIVPMSFEKYLKMEEPRRYIWRANWANDCRYWYDIDTKWSDRYYEIKNKTVNQKIEEIDYLINKLKN